MSKSRADRAKQRKNYEQMIELTGEISTVERHELKCVKCGATFVMDSVEIDEFAETAYAGGWRSERHHDTNESGAFCPAHARNAREK